MKVTFPHLFTLPLLAENHLCSVFGVRRPPDLVTTLKAGKVLIYSCTESAILNTFVFTVLFSVRQGCTPHAVSLTRGSDTGPAGGSCRRAFPWASSLRDAAGGRASGPENLAFSRRSPCHFQEDVSKEEYKVRRSGYLNKRRHGCCEWHMVNEKQLTLALANYVMTVGESHPYPAKLYFLSSVLKKSI